jgi:hypothetical protein
MVGEPVVACAGGYIVGYLKITIPEPPAPEL